MAGSQKERVVIVGAGFAGFNAARELSRLIGATTEIVVINSTDYFLYLPLMPQVTGGSSLRSTSWSRWPNGCAKCGSCSAPWTTSTPSRRR
jgi:NADH dehydrogenase FAD-containing subunit